MPVGDIWKFSCVATCYDQVGMTSVFGRVTIAAAPEPSALEAAVLIDTGMAPLMKACISSLAVYQGVIAQKVWPPPLTPAGTTTLNLGVGASGPRPMPTQVSGIATIQTGLAGRAQRGRTYMPFPSDGDTELPPLHGPTPGYITRLDNFMTLWLATVLIPSAGGGNITVKKVIYHRTTHTTTDVVGWQSRKKWATQRRRGDYGRPNPAL